jgi:hypothetical protein
MTCTCGKSNCKCDKTKVEYIERGSSRICATLGPPVSTVSPVFQMDDCDTPKTIPCLPQAIVDAINALPYIPDCP